MNYEFRNYGSQAVGDLGLGAQTKPTSALHNTLFTIHYS
jgi:hypothetical protein